MKKCSRCKKEKDINEFYIRKNGVNPWCKECYKSWHLERYKVEHTTDPKICLHCDLIFIPGARRKSLFCSRNCKDLFRAKKDKQERIESKQERKCLHCGSTITQERRIDAVFCSEKCNNKAHQLQRKLRVRSNESGKRGYLRLDICERDGWICQICKEPVDKNASHPEPLAGSLDHIIPVSKGGSSDPSNLQLTHLRCNLKRGNKAL